MSAAQILADLADGGGEQLEPEPEPEHEEQVVLEDQTLEAVDIDLLVSGVQRPAASHSAYFAENLLVLD